MEKEKLNEEELNVDRQSNIGSNIERLHIDNIERENAEFVQDVYYTCELLEEDVKLTKNEVFFLD